MYDRKNLLCDDAKIWIPYYDSCSIAFIDPDLKSKFKISRVSKEAEYMHNPLYNSTADAKTSALLQECADTFTNDPPVDGFVFFEYIFTESIKNIENVEGTLLQLFTSKASKICLSVGGRDATLIPESSGSSREYTDAFIKDFVKERSLFMYSSSLLGAYKTQQTMYISMCCIRERDGTDDRQLKVLFICIL